MLAVVVSMLLILTMGGVVVGSLVVGKFLPWSSAPIEKREAPFEFFLYVSSFFLVALALTFFLWKWLVSL